MPIYKRCSGCGKRILESERCSCMSRRHKEYDKTRDTNIRRFYSGSRWNTLAAYMKVRYQGLDIYELVIKARRRGKGKLTLELIKRTVEAYTYAQTEVKFDGIIHIAFTSVYGRPPNMEDVYATIENIKPAHIPVEYTFRYRTHDDIRNCMATHQKLSEITHEEIRSGQVDFLPINGGR